MEIVKTLWPRLRAQWPELLLAGLAMLLLAGASAAYAALTGPVLKSLFGGGSIVPMAWMEKYVHIDWHYAWSIPVAIIAVAVVKGGAQAVQFSLTGRVSLKTVQGLRQSFAHLLSLSPRFYGEHNTADLLSRLTNDGERVEQALFYGLAPVVRESITVAALLGFCVVLDPLLSLFAFLIIPLSALPLVRFSKWLKAVSRRSQDNLSDLSFTSFEALSGVRTVQAFTLEPNEMERFATASSAHGQAMKKSYFIRAIRTPAMEVLGAFGVAVLIYFMAQGVASRALDGAHVASFAIAVVLMYEPIKKLGNVGDWFAQGAAALERMQELTHTRIEIVSGDKTPPAKTRGELVFSHVDFSYRADKPVLRDLSLSVAAGSMCALVGRSGAGKSTLMQLVLRFYDPLAGDIQLDGLSLRQWPLSALRQRLAWVSQDIFLFNASVRDNISAGVHKTDGEIEAALQAAFALDFVRELPRGLDSILGERGITLSGGQRQRVAIARAFLRDAPLLLLDEATSALDTQSERMVQAALDRLMVGRTTLVIAHRLSTIERANQIAVMDAGQVIQIGTHTQLLAEVGEYRALAGQV